MISAAEQELIARVAEAPDDDAPRLVLADWLGQQGEPRGELIVTACTLTRDDVPIGVRRALVKRHDALLREHGRRWLAELGLRADEGRFVRGMVEEAQVGSPTLMKNIDIHFASTPLRALRVIDPDFDTVRLLSFSPHVSRLRALTLDRLARGLASQLLEIQALESLSHFRISDTGVTDDEVRVLVESKRFLALGSLQLDRNRIGTRGAVALADAEHLPALVSLDLMINEIGDAGARALASAPQRKLLRVLGVNHNRLTQVGAIAISDTSHLTQLNTLDLGFNDLGDRGITALGRSMWLGGLTTLNLERTHFTAVGARALAVSTRFPNLTMLELAYNDLPAAEQELLRAHFNGRVRF